VETIPWYKSAIIRQQIVQLLIAGSAFFGITNDQIDWDQTVGAIFAGVGALVAIWTIVTRFTKPSPNLTAQAAAKEKELVAKGAIPKQGGFASFDMLVGLVCVVAVAAIVSGCAGTKQAYRAADSLPDQAFVVAEHYAALVKEAADLAQNPATPEPVKEQLRAADRVLKPLVIGEPSQIPPRPGLRELAAAYQATRTAQTEAELQAAVNNAVVALAGFIKAVKAARGEYVGSIDADSGRASKRCARAGIERPDEDLGRAVCVG
jgi:hypothetical protein